jgi:hypothetical protein
METNAFLSSLIAGPVFVLAARVFGLPQTMTPLSVFG